MPNQDQSPEGDIFKDVGKFLTRVGLDADFYERLIRDADDWSFTVKLHALIETGLTDAITAALRKPELEPVLGRLPLRGPAGKLAFAAKLGLVGDNSRRFVELISEMRNRLAHTARGFTLTMTQFLEARPASERVNAAKQLGYVLRPQIELEGKMLDQVDFVMGSPRFAAWLSGAETLAVLHVNREIEQMKQSDDQMAITRGQQVIDAFTAAIPQHIRLSDLSRHGLLGTWPGLLEPTSPPQQEPSQAPATDIGVVSRSK